MDYGDKPAAAKRSLLTPPRWSLFAPPLTNFLNNVSVPWKLTCDELIYCHQGTFRLMCDGEAYVLNPGDMMLVPKDNEIAYEADGKCVIFYAASPVDRKQRAGITEVPGIDPEDM